MREPNLGSTRTPPGHNPEALGDNPVLPREENETGRLLVLATIERLLYEIRYELTHRPELVTVPLADLRALLEY